MKAVKLFSLFLAVTFLSSCSYFGSKLPGSSRDYTLAQARSIPPLRIPAGVSSSAFHNKYPAPYQSGKTAGATVDITPPGIA